MLMKAEFVFTKAFWRRDERRLSLFMIVFFGALAAFSVSEFSDIRQKMAGYGGGLVATIALQAAVDQRRGRCAWSTAWPSEAAGYVRTGAATI